MATHRAAGWISGLALVASGALMCAASVQRWAGACTWGQRDATTCLSRQDHLYDFIAPAAPWAPVGAAAMLAGWSLLLLALAFLPLPQAVSRRRPGFATNRHRLFVMVSGCKGVGRKVEILRRQDIAKFIVGQADDGGGGGAGCPHLRFEG